MPATPLNAPARPLLTRTLILVLAIALLAAVALHFVSGGSGTLPDPVAADRPAFIRRTASDR